MDGLNINIATGGSFWAAMAAFVAMILFVIYEIFATVFHKISGTTRGGGAQKYSVDDLLAALRTKCQEAEYEEHFRKAWKIRDHEAVETLADLEKLKWRMKYTPSCNYRRIVTHNGQIKLGTSEIRFLTDETSPDDPADGRMAGDFSVMMVYAGAAPSNKHGLLCKMFPRVKFLLVDPNPFDLKWVSAREAATIHRGSDGEYDAAQLLSAAMKNPAQTIIINDLFTADLAEAMGELLPGSLFVSDIRTNMYGTTGEQKKHWLTAGPQRQVQEEFPEVPRQDFSVAGGCCDGAAFGGSVRQGKFATDKKIGPNQHGAHPDAADILWNYAQQFNWCRAMKPRACMTKFRHPFYSDPDHFVEAAFNTPLISAEFARALKTVNGVPGIDFRENYRARKLVWFDGQVDLQMFAPASSTETRLRFTGKKIKDWGSHHDYEDHFYAFNNIYRWVANFRNESSASILGYDHCADCAMLDKSLRKYLSKFGAKWRGEIGEKAPEWCAESFKVGGVSAPGSHLSPAGEKSSFDMTKECRRLLIALCDITERSLLRDNHGHFGVGKMRGNSAENPGHNLEILVPALQRASRGDLHQKKPKKDFKVEGWPNKKWGAVAATLPADMVVCASLKK